MSLHVVDHHRFSFFDRDRTIPGKKDWTLIPRHSRLHFEMLIALFLKLGSGLPANFFSSFWHEHAGRLPKARSISGVGGNMCGTGEVPVRHQQCLHNAFDKVHPHTCRALSAEKQRLHLSKLRATTRCIDCAVKRATMRRRSVF